MKTFYECVTKNIQKHYKYIKALAFTLSKEKKQKKKGKMTQSSYKTDFMFIWTIHRDPANRNEYPLSEEDLRRHKEISFKENC